MVDLYRELGALLAERARFLPDKPEENGESTLRALWHCAAGVPKSAEQALLVPLPKLDDAAIARLRSLIEQRIAGVPLAHITQRQRFMGMELLAGPEALVPRKETELLAGAVVDLASRLSQTQTTVRVVDVCCGSGNVALAAAYHVPATIVFASDLSADAVGLARRNAVHLGLQERSHFRSGDLLAPFDTPEFHGKVDVLSCNPPYISSAKVSQMDNEIAAHEPSMAFDGGPFGIAILMRLIQDAPRFLRPGGYLAFEVGLGQGPGMVKRLEKSGSFEEVRALQDAAGAPRCIVARYRGSM